MLDIITYPHPTLRYKSKPLRRVDAELHDIVTEMFELMYESNGVGLAANQIDLPLRLFVVNPEGEPEKGEQLVFINPVISHPKGSEEAEEGCLSLPGLYGKVTRPKKVRVNAYNLKGEEVHCEVDGFLARVIQHENDHLDGVLFIDRLSETGKIEVQDALAEFATDFTSRRGTGALPDDEVIHARLREWEQRYC